MPSPSRRLNINLPANAYEDLRLLAANSGRSMTEVVRASLGLAKLAYEAEKSDRVLAVASKEGKVLTQLVVL